MTSTYLGYQLYAGNITKSLARVAAEPTNASATAYYQANIGKVTNVDDFLNNYKLFTYAMNAYGLSDLGNAKALMKKVLESNLSDPTSFANTMSDSRYRAFAKAYQFSASGTLANTAQLQTSTQQSDTEARFAAASTEDSAAQASDTAYYEAHIGNVRSVGDIEKDSRLYNYVKTAYGLDSSMSNYSFEDALKSDPSNPKSFAATTSNQGLQQLAQDFNFASDGSVSSPEVIQSSADVSAAVAAYQAASGTGKAATAAAATEATYYQSTISTVTSLDGLLGNSRLVAFVEKAYGIPTTTTTSQLKAVLTSDLTDPKSTANTMGAAYRSLAAAFNVSTTGGISHTPNVQAQSRSGIAATVDAYNESSMETEAGNSNEGVRLALYFKSKASSITSAYSILADKALTEVTQVMLGLSSMSSNADIDSQAATINSKLNLADLKDPAKVDKLVARFAALYDLQNNSSQNSTVSLLF